MSHPAYWLRHQPVKDLQGKSFGLITVIRQAPSDGHGSRWMCRCQCGDERVLRRAEVVKGVKTHRSCKESA